MVVVVGGNVLHHVKREGDVRAGDMSGGIFPKKKCPRKLHCVSCMSTAGTFDDSIFLHACELWVNATARGHSPPTYSHWTFPRTYHRHSPSRTIPSPILHSAGHFPIPPPPSDNLQSKARSTVNMYKIDGGRSIRVSSMGWCHTTGK